MELQTFIRASLTQIVNGIKEAQDDPKNAGAVIVPMRFFDGDKKVHWPKAETRVTKVDFDVAVSAEETAKGGGKASLAVMGVGLSGGGGKEKSASSVSRIKFEIMIVLPGKDEKGAEQ